jgi:hypothetical protein
LLVGSNAEIYAPSSVRDANWVNFNPPNGATVTATLFTVPASASVTRVQYEIALVPTVTTTELDDPPAIALVTAPDIGLAVSPTVPLYHV